MVIDTALLIEAESVITGANVHEIRHWTTLYASLPGRSIKYPQDIDFFNKRKDVYEVNLRRLIAEAKLSKLSVERK